MPGLVHSLLSGPTCMACGTRGDLLCNSCARTVPPAGAEVLASGERAIAAWIYAGVARRLILALKIRGLRDAARPLADAMHRAVVESGVTGDVLTWVPGRARDIRRRGFDHAEVLARLLGRDLGLPARPLVVRIADRPDQTSLSRQQRQINLAGAFAARGLDTTDGRDGPRIILVDDLLTTGATAVSCASALSRGGGGSIEVLVASRVLRTIGPGSRG